MAKILLVDDAAFMRMMVKNTLNENGYTDLYEASDGAEAVTKYAELKPDLVIMDITMPNMDGLEALKAIRKADPNASVVMCSAMGQEAMVIEAIKSGAKDFIVKPFKPDRIIKTVRSVFHATVCPSPYCITDKIGSSFSADASSTLAPVFGEIGRASCRERV